MSQVHNGRGDGAFRRRAVIDRQYIVNQGHSLPKHVAPTVHPVITRGHEFR
jgi:hypothetical protein